MTASSKLLACAALALGATTALLTDRLTDRVAHRARLLVRTIAVFNWPS